MRTPRTDLGRARRALERIQCRIADVGLRALEAPPTVGILLAEVNSLEAMVFLNQRRHWFQQKQKLLFQDALFAVGIGAHDLGLSFRYPMEEKRHDALVAVFVLAPKPNDRFAQGVITNRTDVRRPGLGRC